jgi:hypothetical protein
MRFVNDTSMRAGLLRSERPDGVMAAALIARRCFLVDGARLVEQPADPKDAGPRTEPALLEDFGELPADELPPRLGTDVIVLGDAISPKPTIATRVSVAVGPYKLDLDVFGDRVWEGPPGGLMPSSPQPFTRMPISWARAYGGEAKTEYGLLPYHKNPRGRGYYLSASEARGSALPNIERAGAHIKRWEDKPDPVGFGPYPVTWGLRAEKITRFDGESEKLAIDFEGGMFDRAHPELSGQRVTEGPLVVKGMTASGSLTLELPPFLFVAEIALGPSRFLRKLELEEILLDLRGEQPRLELSYRNMFRYPFVKHQARCTRLVPQDRAQLVGAAS